MEANLLSFCDTVSCGALSVPDLDFRMARIAHIG